MNKIDRKKQDFFFFFFFFFKQTRIIDSLSGFITSCIGTSLKYVMHYYFRLETAAACPFINTI